VAAACEGVDRGGGRVRALMAFHYLTIQLPVASGGTHCIAREMEVVNIGGQHCGGVEKHGAQDCSDGSACALMGRMHAVPACQGRADRRVDAAARCAGAGVPEPPAPTGSRGIPAAALEEEAGAVVMWYTDTDGWRGGYSVAGAAHALPRLHPPRVSHSDRGISASMQCLVCLSLGCGVPAHGNLSEHKNPIRPLVSGLRTRFHQSL
jgi:uncharacterized membrane protein